MPESEMTEERRAAIRFGRRGDWIIAVTIMVIAIVFIYLLQSLPVRAKFYPWFITISVMLVGGVYAFIKLRNPAVWDAQYDPAIEMEQGERDTGPAYLVPHLRAVLRVFAVFLALVLAALALGPKIAVPIFVTLALWMNGENKVVAVLSGVAFWLVTHFVFGKAMSINLPAGFLLEVFG